MVLTHFLVSNSKSSQKPIESKTVLVWGDKLKNIYGSGGAATGLMVAQNYYSGFKIIALQSCHELRYVLKDTAEAR